MVRLLVVGTVGRRRKEKKKKVEFTAESLSFWWAGQPHLFFDKTHLSTETVQKSKRDW